MGKSTLGIDFARAAALHHHLTTIVFSLEMSKVELAQRIISAETDIPLGALRRADEITRQRPAVHRRFAEYESDGDPCEMPPTQADQ